MIVYFVRHGEATDHAADDFTRELTPRGRTRTENLAIVLKRLEVHLTHLWTSPRIRALQTAQIIEKGLGITAEIRDSLDLGFGMEALVELLQPLNDDAEVMLVGHNPSMSDVVSALTGTMVEIKKGGLACVEIDLPIAMKGALTWFIPPKMFDALK